MRKILYIELKKKELLLFIDRNNQTKSVEIMAKQKEIEGDSFIFKNIYKIITLSNTFSF